MTRSINSSKSATMTRQAALFFIFTSLVSFVLALALRLWYMGDLGFPGTDANCGLWDCRINDSYSSFNFPDANDENKMRAVRAFVVLGSIGSLISLVLAGFAYMSKQDLLAKLVPVFMIMTAVCGVIAFAVYINLFNDISGDYGAGFAFDIIAVILSLVSVVLSIRANNTIISQS